MQANYRHVTVLSLVILIAVSCGTARRIVGDQRILPPGDEIQVTVTGTVAENKVVTFSLPQGSWRAGVSSLNYSWDFGNGATPNTSNLAQPVVTLAAAAGDTDKSYEGQLTLSIWRQDKLEGPRTYKFSFTVPDTAAELPLVSINGISPTTVVLGNEATFNADVTVTPDDAGWSYRWDLTALNPDFVVEDRTHTEGGKTAQVVATSLPATGPYEISLLAFRTASPEIRSELFTTNVAVASTVMLDVQAVVPSGVLAGTSQLFSAVIVKEPMDTALDYIWDVAQISESATAAQITSATPIFDITAAPSTTPYKCKLTVQQTGQPTVKDTLEFEVTVRSGPIYVPTIAIDDVYPTNLVGGTEQQLQAAVHTSNGATDFSYAWDVANVGTPALGSSLTAASPVLDVISTAGSYTGRLHVWLTSEPTVRAVKDLQFQVVAAAPVAPGPPMASILELGPGTVYEGEVQTFGAVINSNLDQTKLVYLWDLSALGAVDDINAKTPEVTMAVLPAGSYQVSLSVYSPAPGSVLLDSTVIDVTYIEQP